MKKQIGLVALIALLITFVAFSGVASAQANNAGNSARATEFTSPMCAVCVKVSPMIQASAAKYGVKLTVIDVSTAEGRGVAQANGVTETPTLVTQGAQSSRLEGDMTQAQIDAAMQAAVGNTAVKNTAAPTPAATVPSTPSVATPVKATPVAQKQVATPTPASKATASQPQVPNAAYIGNKDSRIVHVASCFHVKQMKPANMVGFNSLAEATAAGFTPCKDCIGNVTPSKTPTVTPSVTPTASAQPKIQVLQPQTQTQTTTQQTATQTVPEFSLLGLGAPALVIGAIYLFMRRK